MYVQVEFSSVVDQIIVSRYIRKRVCLLYPAAYFFLVHSNAFVYRLIFPKYRLLHVCEVFVKRLLTVCFALAFSERVFSRRGIRIRGHLYDQ